MLRLRNSSQSYGIIAQAFHWLLVLLVFAQIAIGLYAARLPVSMARLQWVSHHKSLGITILALVLLRFAWRLFDRPPALPDTMPGWERRAAIGTHRLLYLLLILAPFAGWLFASAAGLSVDWFGVFHVPDLMAKNHGLVKIFKVAHGLSVALLVLVLVLHIAAALRHAARGDGVVRRMIPWNAPPAS